ncbi:MAG TPA: glycosyltransferase [Geminicoccaceae bacterium]|nr:glycosyltransferase [Geminicoccaceae bacterium]
MILVAVGTFVHGFDALVVAADIAACQLGLPGFAQIGNSAAVPRHLAWERFLPLQAMAERVAASAVVVCHGGIGLLGEAMRAGKPIVAVPRRGQPTPASPAGDQTALVRRLAERHPIRVCEQPHALPRVLGELVAAGLRPCRYDLGSDIPAVLARYLAAGAAQSLPARSS